MTSIEGLIRGIRAGDRSEFDRLFAALYDELRRIARRHLRNRAPGQTLDTTALIHEAYLRMVDQSLAEWADRAHFFAYASRVMRDNLASLLWRSGKPAEAEAREPLELRLAAMDSASPGVALAWRDLGISLARLGRYDEAEPLLPASYPVIQGHWGEDHETARLARVEITRLERRKVGR